MCGNPKNIHIYPHTIHTYSHTYTVPLLSVSGRSLLTWLGGGSANAQAQKNLHPLSELQPEAPGTGILLHSSLTIQALMHPKDSDTFQFLFYYASP